VIVFEIFLHCQRNTHGRFLSLQSGRASDNSGGEIAREWSLETVSRLGQFLAVSPAGRITTLFGRASLSVKKEYTRRSARATGRQFPLHSAGHAPDLQAETHGGRGAG
jgi:hypothetical protein